MWAGILSNILLTSYLVSSEIEGPAISFYEASCNLPPDSILCYINSDNGIFLIRSLAKQLPSTGPSAQ
jgi:hypothetical protein